MAIPAAIFPVAAVNEQLSIPWPTLVSPRHRESSRRYSAVIAGGDPAANVGGGGDSLLDWRRGGGAGEAERVAVDDTPVLISIPVNRLALSCPGEASSK